MIMKELKIILFDSEELTRTLVKSYLKDMSFNYKIECYDEFDENLISNSSFLNIIIVSINKANINLLNKIYPLSVNKKNHFIIISYENITDLHVKALRAGAEEFLLKPLIKTDFIHSIQNIYKKNIINSEKKSSSNVYSVMSFENGTGKTFFAINLAKELADLTKEKVLLVDFNNNLNDVSFLLNITPVYSTFYFIENLSEDNASEILSQISKYKNTSMHVMANSLYNNMTVSVNPEKIRDFVQILRKYYKYILIDLSPLFQKANEMILNNTDIIFCLTQSHISSLEKTKRMINVGFSRRNIKIILNKFSSKDAAKINEFQKILGREIFWKIPKNILATSVSLNKGKTLKEISPDMDVVKSYIQLAQYITGRD